MSFDIFIELKNGEKVSIKKPDGHFFGKEYASLISRYHYYLLELETDINANKWFKRLEQQSENQIKTIDNATYIGDWEYTMDDYEKYIRDWGGAGEVSEEKFKEMLTEINTKWTSIEGLIISVEKILKAIPVLYTEEFFWFSPKGTILGFQGLLNTLRRLHEEGNELVRIQIL